jgi:hypothetical protein
MEPVQTRVGPDVPRRCTRSLRVWAGLLLCLALCAPAGAFAQQPERLVVARPYAKLHAQPSEASRAIAIVYGNDTLDVLERKDGWVKVSAGSKATGWLSPEDANATGPANPASAPATAARPAPAAAAAPSRASAALVAPPTGPTSASVLRRLGYEEAARRKLTDQLLRDADSPYAYEATREMLTYHPVGELPPLKSGSVPPESREAALRLRQSVLLLEAQQLVKEGKPWDAVFLYQSLVQSNAGDGRAYLALLDLLTQLMNQAVESQSLENLGLATSIYRATYPDLPLPPAVQARNGSKQ